MMFVPNEQVITFGPGSALTLETDCQLCQVP